MAVRHEPRGDRFINSFQGILLSDIQNSDRLLNTLKQPNFSMLLLLTLSILKFLKPLISSNEDILLCEASKRCSFTAADINFKSSSLLNDTLIRSKYCIGKDAKSEDIKLQLAKVTEYNLVESKHSSSHSHSKDTSVDTQHKKRLALALSPLSTIDEAISPRPNHTAKTG